MQLYLILDFLTGEISLCRAGASFPTGELTLTGEHLMTGEEIVTGVGEVTGDVGGFVTGEGR